MAGTLVVAELRGAEQDVQARAPKDVRLALPGRVPRRSPSPSRRPPSRWRPPGSATWPPASRGRGSGSASPRSSSTSRPDRKASAAARPATAQLRQPARYRAMEPALEQNERTDRARLRADDGQADEGVEHVARKLIVEDRRRRVQSLERAFKKSEKSANRFQSDMTRPTRRGRTRRSRAGQLDRRRGDRVAGSAPGSASRAQGGVRKELDPAVAPRPSSVDIDRRRGRRLRQARRRSRTGRTVRRRHRRPAGRKPDADVTTSATSSATTTTSSTRPLGRADSRRPGEDPAAAKRCGKALRTRAWRRHATPRQRVVSPTPAASTLKSLVGQAEHAEAQIRILASPKAYGVQQEAWRQTGKVTTRNNLTDRATALARIADRLSRARQTAQG